MEIDVQIRNATLEEVQQIFGKVPTVHPDKPKIIPSIEVTPEIIAGIAKAIKIEADKVIKVSSSLSDLRDENLGRSTIPGDELKSRQATKKETGNRYHQKWDIPFNSTTESAKYEMARKLCKRFGKPYPEALKFAESMDAKKERTIGLNKWQIPFGSKTQAHEYYRAWTLCRKYNLPYPDALKRQEEEGTGVILRPASTNVAKRGAAPLAESPGKQPAATKPAKSKKASGHQVTCLYCEHACNSHAMHLHVRNKHPEKYKEYLNRKSAELGKEVEVVKKPFPSSPTMGTAALPSQEQKPVMEPVVPDEDPLDIHIEGIEGLEDNPDNLDREMSDPSPIQDDPEEQPSPADETKAGDEGNPPEKAPEQPGGLRRGQQVKHNGSKSDPHYGETGTIERLPQNLQECLVRFRLSSSWVNKEHLIPIEEAQ